MNNVLLTGHRPDKRVVLVQWLLTTHRQEGRASNIISLMKRKEGLYRLIR